MSSQMARTTTRTLTPRGGRGACMAGGRGARENILHPMPPPTCCPKGPEVRPPQNVGSDLPPGLIFIEKGTKHKASI